MGSAAKPKLPILDFTLENLNPGTSCWIKTCNEVREALEEYGCFIVECNILSRQLREAAYGALKELFDLPTETKMKNQYVKPLSGYVGQIDKIPLHESMGIDNVTSLQATQDFTTLMWPDGNDHFCKSVYEYAKVAAELDDMVTRMIFESYGVDKYHDSFAESTTYLLRLLKNRAPKGDESNLAFITHTDKSFTTILHQDHINALQVDTRDGENINVEFLPSSFVVLAGEALTAWSNDRIVAPSHRVIMNGKADRYSTGLFSFNSGVIQVPQELVDEDHPLMYKPFDHIGLLHFFRTHQGSKTQSCTVKAFCGI